MSDPLIVTRGIELNGGKITGAADGVDPDDLATVGQIPAGSLPDPSGEPDGSWLRTASGAAIWVAAPTTADVPDSTDRRYLTDAQQTDVAALDTAAFQPASAFDASGAAAAAAAASQPLDVDLTAIAGLDSSTAGAISSDGAGWIKKTYSQFKTALSLVKGDVGLGNVDNTSDADKPVSATVLAFRIRKV